MNFKSAVIICALYFVTVTQSIGLNEDQLINIRKFNKNNISNKDIEDIGIQVGLNMPGFVNEIGVSNARKLQAILVFLANNDKTTDSLKKRYLSPFEVRLYVDLFSEYDQRANCDALPDNVLDFLRLKCEGKPEGDGINQVKVQELLNLRGNDPTIKNKHLNPDKVTQLFKTLNIVEMNYEGRFAFDSTRNPFLELQELLIILAEYSSYNNQGGPVYSTSIVRYVLTAFSKLDADKDGLLSKDDVSKLLFPRMNRLKRLLKIGPCMKKHDTNGDQHLDILELFMALFTAGKDLSKYDVTVNPRYND